MGASSQTKHKQVESFTPRKANVMRTHTRWIIGAILGLAAACFAASGLPLEQATPAHAQTASCPAPSGTVTILSITPTSMNNATASTITINGNVGSFENGATVVLGNYSALPSTFVSDAQITVLVPTSIPGSIAGTVYDVTVINPGGSCNVSPDNLTVYGPNPTVAPMPVSTATREATPLPTAFVRPLVTVLSYGASSRVLYPGQDIDFEITLQNSGQIVAKNVIVEFSGNDLLPRETGGLRTPGDIAAGGSVRFFQPLRVSNNLSGYQAVINIKISYTDEYGAKYSDSSTLSFDAGQYAQATATLSMSPQLILSSYQTTPAVLSPGAVFKLDLSLANVSSQTAHQVLVDLNTTGSSSSSAGTSASAAPVAPQNSSNLRYIDQMQPGQQVPLSFDMAVNGSATSTLANLSLAISYTDDSGKQRSQTEVISLRIETQALLFIHFYNEMPDVVTVGDIIDLPIEVINIGENDLNVGIVEVSSDQMSITGSSIYFGPLSGGTSGTLLAQAQVTRAGTATMTVTVHYLDDYQQPQVFTHDMTLEVEAMAATPAAGTGAPGSTGTGTPGGDLGGLTIGQRILRMFLGFFGIATQSAGGGGDMSQFRGGNWGGGTPQPSGGNTP